MLALYLLTTFAATAIFFRKVWRNHFPSGAVSLTLSLALAILLTEHLRWVEITSLAELRVIIGCAAATLAWRYSTNSWALGELKFSMKDRVLLVLCSLGILHSAAWLFPVLVLVGRHTRVTKSFLHEHLSISLLIVSCICVATHVGISVALGNSLDNSCQAFDNCLFMSIMSCLGSMYFKPGYSKLLIGQKPLDWIKECRLHYQVIGGYVWGWLSFLSPKRVVGLTNSLQRFNRLFGAAVVVAELGTAFLGLGRTYTCVIVLVLLSFHLGYLLMTGNLFWENSLILLSVIHYVGSSETTTTLPWGLAHILMLVLVAGYGQLFQIPALTWWELPIVQRVYFEVVSEGRRFFLSHKFMETRGSEFYFGLPEMMPRKVLNCNLTHCNLPMGEVRELLKITDQGILPHCILEARTPQKSEREAAFILLLETLRSLKRQDRREFLSPRFSWLKSPGTHLATGGRGQIYRGERPVDQLRLVYEEAFFDGKTIQTSEQIVMAVDGQGLKRTSKP